MPNKYGTTPLNWAASNGHAHACRVVLDHGGRSDLASGLGDTAISGGKSKSKIEGFISLSLYCWHLVSCGVVY